MESKYSENSTLFVSLWHLIFPVAQKMKALLPLLVLCLSLITSCNLEKDQVSDLTGKWLRTDAPPENGLNDTILFSADGQAVIQGKAFLFDIDSDSIRFTYNGNLYIYCPMSSHSYSISGPSPTLSIENLNKLCLIETDRGISIYKKITE